MKGKWDWCKLADHVSGEERVCAWEPTFTGSCKRMKGRGGRVHGWRDFRQLGDGFYENGPWLFWTIGHIWVLDKWIGPKRIEK